MENKTDLFCPKYFDTFRDNINMTKQAYLRLEELINILQKDYLKLVKEYEKLTGKEINCD